MLAINYAAGTLFHQCHQLCFGNVAHKTQRVGPELDAVHKIARGGVQRLDRVRRPVVANEEGVNQLGRDRGGTVQPDG